MYAPFFGLQHAPFSIAPDPRYLFMSERHREALAHLLYGLGGGGGFVLLSGEIGTGKTTVCRCFLDQVPADCHVAYIFNPKLTALELLQSVCEEFHLPVRHEGPGAVTAKDCIAPLNDFLLQAHAAGQSCVLIIDEAQNLSPDVLEQLRLLTNLETRDRKLLQIILIGQPELRQMLARPELEQLSQRVIARFHLGALTEAETAEYIRHRLAVAGLRGPAPFTPRALRRIHQLARGVPRRINLLCDRALLGAYAHRQASVDHRIVAQAAREVFDHDAVPAPHRRARIAALAGGAALAALGALAWTQGASDWLATDRQAAPRQALAVTPAAASLPATAASAPASSPAASKAAPAIAEHPVSRVTDLADLWLRLPHRQDEAWRALAPAWGAALGPGDPCAEAARQQLQCFSGRLNLALVRQLARPGVLRLRSPDGATAHALLIGLNERDALLQLGEQRHAVALTVLARAWQGEFATFWRSGPEGPPRPAPGSGGPAVDALARRLAQAEGAPAPTGAQTLDAALRQRIEAFQLAQGLTADGRPGALTLMQLNRATGVAEPRLLTE